MTYLHARKPAIIHKDLRSSNILVSSSGLKICDFDLAERVKRKSMLTMREVLANARQKRNSVADGTENKRERTATVDNTEPKSERRRTVGRRKTEDKASNVKSSPKGLLC